MKRLIIVILALLITLSACAVQRHKLSAQGNVNLKTANVYYAQKNVEEARKYYTLVVQDNPDHALALRRLADIDMYDAERFADRAVELNKSAYERYSKALVNMEKYAKPKEKELAEIRDIKKRKTSSWTRVFKAAEAQQQAGNTLEAIKIFETVSAMDTTRIEPLVKLKDIYMKDLKDEAKAEEILLDLYAKDSTNPILLQELGIFYMNKQDYAAAIPFLEKVKQIEPLNANNLMNLAYSQFKLDQFENARINNQLVLNLEPNNLFALTDAKLIAYKLDDKETAVMYLKRLLNERDDDKDYQEISFLLNELKNYEDMITYAKKWHAYDELNKDAVLLVILGAQKTGNKTLETEYQTILKRMN